MLHAMFMLVILTTVIMVLTARVRIGSVKSGEVPQNYYSLMQGHDIPDFVAARMLHSIIHLSYNNGVHRLVIFAIGNLSVLVMWLGIVNAAG